MKVCLLILFLIVFFFRVKPAKAELSRLHVEGKYIKNTFNQTVYLTGVAFVDRNYGVCNYWRDLNNSERVNKANEWGIKPLIWYWTNHFRWYGWVNVSNEEGCTAGSYPWADGNTTRYIEDYRKAVDEDMEILANNGFYVVIKDGLGPTSYGDEPEYNPLTNSTAREVYINYSKEIMSRYYKYPNVIGYELWNEPGWFGYTNETLLAEDWTEFVEDIADAVHSVNPNALIFATTPGLWSNLYRILSYWFENPIQRPNIVYNHDFYYKYLNGEKFYQTYNESNPTLAKQQFESWLFERSLNMTELGYPVISEEWGLLGGPTGNPGEMGGRYNETSNQPDPPLEPDWATVMQDFIDILKKYDVGWTYLSWGYGGHILSNGTLLNYGRNGLFNRNATGHHIDPTIKYNIWLANLKPYLKYVQFLGDLKDLAGNPVSANISLYHSPTDNIFSNSTNTTGFYNLSIPAATYDIQYKMTDFFIPNFYIKVYSIGMESDFYGPITQVTGYPSLNKVSFTINGTGENKTVELLYNVVPNFDVYDSNYSLTVPVIEVRDNQVITLRNNFNATFNSSTGVLSMIIPHMSEHNITISTVTVPETTTTTTTPSGGDGGRRVTTTIPIENATLTYSMPSSLDLYQNETKEFLIKVTNPGTVVLHNITIVIFDIPKDSYSVSPSIVNSLESNQSTYFTVLINTQVIATGSYTLKINITSEETSEETTMTLKVEEKPAITTTTVTTTTIPPEEEKKIEAGINTIKILLVIAGTIAVAMVTVYIRLRQTKVSGKLTPPTGSVLTHSVPTSLDVYRNEKKEFMANVTNPGTMALHNITMEIPSLAERYYTVSPSLIESLEPNQSIQFTVSLNPLNIKPGKYRMKINIKSNETVETSELIITVKEKVEGEE